MRECLIAFIILFFAFSVYADDEYGKIEIHGFLSQGYMISDKYNFWTANTEDGTFEFNEVGLNFSTNLTDNLSMGVQFFAKDLGKIGNDAVVIDWAYADYRFRNWLGVRIGKVKRPAGIYNQSRDIDAARTSIFPPTSLYNDKFRAASISTKGAGLYGLLPARFEYQLTYGVMDIPSDSPAVAQATKAFGAVAEKTKVENSTTFQLLWNTPIQGLLVGGTILDYDFDAITMDNLLRFYGYHYIYSIEYIYNNINISAEYKSGKDKFEYNGTEITNNSPEDYFAQASYRFNNFFEFGSSYSVSHRNKHDRDGDEMVALGKPAAAAWFKDFALSTRFNINDFWIFKLEAHSMNGLRPVEYTGASPSKRWYLYAAKTTFTF